MWKNTKVPNLDPVIYQGGKILWNWLGYCLAYVQTAFGAGWAGATAWDGWSSVQGKHADRNFPIGVYIPIWFSHTGTYGGVRKNWGHVAILRRSADGTIKIWSSPLSAKYYADTFNSIAEVERAFGAQYVGWSEFVGPTRVLSYTPTVSDAQIRQAYLDILERPADANGLQHYRNQVAKGWTLTQIRNDLLTSQERNTLLANKEAARKAQEAAAKKAEDARKAAEKAQAEAKARKEREEAERLAEEARKAQEEADRLAEEELRKKEEQAQNSQIPEIDKRLTKLEKLVDSIVNFLQSIFKNFGGK